MIQVQVEIFQTLFKVATNALNDLLGAAIRAHNVPSTLVRTSEDCEDSWPRQASKHPSARRIGLLGTTDRKRSRWQGKASKKHIMFMVQLRYWTYEVKRDSWELQRLLECTWKTPKKVHENVDLKPWLNYSWSYSNCNVSRERVQNKSNLWNQANGGLTGLCLAIGKKFNKSLWTPFSTSLMQLLSEWKNKGMRR